MTVPPFDFSHYFLYDEMVDFLGQMEKAYPHLVTLQSIGKSYGNRDIWLATLTNQSTGDPLAKPGYWLDANTHAGEVTGSAVALYNLYSLLTQYGHCTPIAEEEANSSIYLLTHKPNHPTL